MACSPIRMKERLPSRSPQKATPPCSRRSLADGFRERFASRKRCPLGAATALVLATYGVRVHVVNRYNWTANPPRAHMTKQRVWKYCVTWVSSRGTS